MGAAKKVVQLDSKATRKEPARKKVKKVELTEVVRETKPEPASFHEFADLARSLTREKSLSHDEVVHRLPPTGHRPGPNPNSACGLRWSRALWALHPEASAEKEAERCPG